MNEHDAKLRVCSLPSRRGFAMLSQTDPLTGAVCAPHGHTAVAICERCGSFACSECSTVLASSQRLCSRCFSDRAAEIPWEMAWRRRPVRAFIATCWGVLIRPMRVFRELPRVRSPTAALVFGAVSVLILFALDVGLGYLAVFISPVRVPWFGLTYILGHLFGSFWRPVVSVGLWALALRVVRRRVALGTIAPAVAYCQPISFLQGALTFALQLWLPQLLLGGDIPLDRISAVLAQQSEVTRYLSWALSLAWYGMALSALTGLRIRWTFLLAIPVDVVQRLLWELTSALVARALV